MSTSQFFLLYREQIIMSFDLIFQNAVGLHQAGRLDEAEAAYRRLLEISPENA